VKDQVIAYLIPAIIVALGLTFIKPMDVQTKQVRGISPLTSLLFVVVAMLFAGSVVELIDYPTLFTFAVTLFTGSLFFIGSKAMGKVVLNKGLPNNAVPEVRTTTETPTSNETKRKFAEVLMSILFILVVIIVAQMWTIPPTGYASNLFGVDLGLVFLMLGEVISLYHYVVYKKPIEKEE
ncbi:MAG: cytochrome bc complex cytochrome b subunit, partial [Metallosphaera sp.]